MSHAISPTPVNPSSVAVAIPDPGDGRTAASVGVPFTSIWSGVLWLYGLLTGTQAHAVSINGTLASGKVTCAGLDTTGTNGIHSGGDLVADHDLGINGNGYVGGTLTVARNHEVQGELYCLNGVTLLRDGVIYGPMQCGSVGRFVHKQPAKIAATVGMSVNVTGAMRYLYTSAAAGSTVTIDDTGAIDGDEFWFASRTSTQIDIKKPGGTTIASLLAASTSVVCIRIDGVWEKFTYT